MNNIEAKENINETVLTETGENGGKSDGEKLFTQKELEKLISDRLRRERRNNSSLMFAKEVINTLQKDGIINADSYAEAAKELAEKLKEKLCGKTADFDCKNEEVKTETYFENQGEAQNAQACEASEVTGTSDAESIEHFTQNFESTGTEKDYSAQETTATGNAENAEFTQGCENDDIESQYRELILRHPEAAENDILQKEAFHEYCRTKRGSLCELYEGFSGIVKTLGVLSGIIGQGQTDSCFDEEQCGASYDKYAAGTISSTGFSRRSASAIADVANDLSPMQRDIARRAGMSYKEYSALLRDIPGVGYMKKQTR